MDKVLVLMSTYNGEKYIQEQIESVIKQINVEVKLLIRDDGSKDKTREIIRNYQGKYNIELVEGKNVGASNSFFELISAAEEAEYYAFADQDDVWDSDKLYVAIEKLKSFSQKPALYSSNTRLVDKTLALIKTENDNPLITLESAFIKNFCTGCTAVFNQGLMNELKAYKPRYVVMHDWWINILVLALGGESIYDVAPHISYRQHDNNVSGAERDWYHRALKRTSKFLKGQYRRDIMAKEIMDGYLPKISVENQKVLRCLGENSKKMIFDKRFRCKKLNDTFLFKVCVLFNKI